MIHYNNGSAVRLQDVATVVDSVQDVRNAGMSDGKPAVLLVISPRAGGKYYRHRRPDPGKLPALRASIPASIQLNIAQDRSPTIRASLDEVERSLMIAVALVILVVFLFLRSGRAAAYSCGCRTGFVDRNIYRYVSVRL